MCWNGIQIPIVCVSPLWKVQTSIQIVIVSTKECLCFPHFEDDKVAFKFSGSFHESVIGWKHLTTCGSVSSWRMNTSYSLQLFIESCGIVIVIKETLIFWHIWHLFVLARETPLPTRCPLGNLKRFKKILLLTPWSVNLLLVACPKDYLCTDQWLFFVYLHTWKYDAYSMLISSKKRIVKEDLGQFPRIW